MLLLLNLAAPLAMGNIFVDKHVEGLYFVGTTATTLVTMGQSVRLALKTAVPSVLIQNAARAAEKA